MDRRKFIEYIGAVSTYGFVPWHSYLIPSGQSQSPGKKLVLIELKGGNDVLNTVIPFENDIYYQLRPKLAIKPSEVLKLDNLFGFNAQLPFLHRQFGDGQLTLINNVGYPNPSRSHFASLDIWHSCLFEDAPESGWLGRYLDTIHDSNVNEASGIEIGNTLGLAMKGRYTHSVAYESFAYSAFLFEALQSSVVEQNANSSLQYVRNTLNRSKVVFEELYQQYRSVKMEIEFPKGVFGDRLGTIARLISANASPEVYFCQLSSFDTHANQLNRQNKLLLTLDRGLEALVSQLRMAGKYDDTLIVMYSEFSRRVMQNASNGTDHGKAGTVFVLGSKLKKAGFYNPPSTLEILDEGDIPYTVDFRSVYSTIINRWLGGESKRVISEPLPDLNFI